MYNAIGYGNPEGNIGGFSRSYYWSSSESSMWGAWYVNFGSVLTHGLDKGDADAGRVRVIRAF